MFEGEGFLENPYQQKLKKSKGTGKTQEEIVHEIRFMGNKKEIVFFRNGSNSVMKVIG